MKVSRSIGALGALTVCGALAFGGAAQAATTVKGTVVHRNARAQSFTVAKRSGALVAIHAARRPAVGRVVVVKARKLANGTYAASKIRAKGRARRARIRGTVTYVRSDRRAYTVSARGVSLLVRRGSRSGARSAVADPTPGVGTVVTVTTSFDDQGDAQEEAVREDGQDTDGTELEGRILAIDQQARTLTLSADDDEDAGAASVLVHVPDAIDLSAFQVGQMVELHVTVQPDGSFLLNGAASDEDGNEADDQGEQQGDLGDDHGDDAEHQQQTQTNQRDGGDGGQDD